MRYFLDKKHTQPIDISEIKDIKWVDKYHIRTKPATAWHAFWLDRKKDNNYRPIGQLVEGQWVQLFSLPDL